MDASNAIFARSPLENPHRLVDLPGALHSFAHLTKRLSRIVTNASAPLKSSLPCVDKLEHRRAAVSPASPAAGKPISKHPRSKTSLKVGQKHQTPHDLLMVDLCDHRDMTAIVGRSFDQSSARRQRRRPRFPCLTGNGPRIASEYVHGTNQRPLPRGMLAHGEVKPKYEFDGERTIPRLLDPSRIRLDRHKLSELPLAPQGLKELRGGHGVTPEPNFDNMVHALKPVCAPPVDESQPSWSRTSDHPWKRIRHSKETVLAHRSLRPLIGARAFSIAVSRKTKISEVSDRPEN